MDEERLSAIEARAEAATPGPWVQEHQFVMTGRRTIAECRLSMKVSETNAVDNATFISHSRQNIPALCAALREAWQERDEALGGIKELRDRLDVYVSPENVKLAGYANGAWDFMVPWMGVVVETMAQMLDEAQAENYVEIDVQHNEKGPLTMTIQRKLGKTANTFRREAEKERDKASAEVERLRKAIRIALEKPKSAEAVRVLTQALGEKE